MSAIEREILTPPADLAAGGRARAASPGRPASGRASGSPWSVAAPRGSWPRRTPPPARRREAARPTPSPRPRCRPAAVRPDGRDLALRHDHRGGPAARLAHRPAARSSRSRRVADSPVARGRRRRSSAAASPTSSRSSRRGLPRRRWRCCADQRSAMPIATRPCPPRCALTAPLPDDALARAVRVPRRRLDGRPGQRGGAQVPRGRGRLGRGLPRHGVPPWAISANAADRRWCGRSARSTARCSNDAARAGSAIAPNLSTLWQLSSRPARGRRARAGPQPRPRPPPQSDPIGGAPVRSAPLASASFSPSSASPLRPAAAARPPPASSGGVTNIVIWHGYPDTEAAAMKKMVAQFNATHPNDPRHRSVLRQHRLRAAEGADGHRRRRSARHLLPVRLVGRQHRTEPQGARR